MSDLLLEWMSFRAEGSADALPAQQLPVPPLRLLGDLAALGHIEMPTAKSWRIAPPVLACLPPDGGREPAAVLCGARTSGLLGQLERACLATGVRMDMTQVANRPSAIKLTAPSLAVLADAASQAGMLLQTDAGYTLLACVPAVRSWPRHSCQMVGGRVGYVRRFSGSRAEWIDSSLEEAAAAPKGLFRIRRDWDRVSIFKSGESDCAYIDDRAGRILAAAKRRHIFWDGLSSTLSLPVALFPPVLVARALVLCTGRLPAFDRTSRRIAFGGVNPAMLRLVLAITGLRLA